MKDLTPHEVEMLLNLRRIAAGIANQAKDATGDPMHYIATAAKEAAESLWPRDEESPDGPSLNDACFHVLVQTARRQYLH